VRRSLVVVLLVVVALAAACTKKSKYDFPAPPSTNPEQSTTVPDFSAVRLAAVPGRTTTTVDNSPGQAHMAGNVVAPEGAVPGATVHIERLVGDSVLAIDVATNPDGTFKVDNIKGGRYRVRAWRMPDLAMTTPQVFFLNGNENRTNVSLQVNHFTGTNVVPAIAPNPPRVGEPANLAVQVTAVVVDPNGVVRATPQVGVQVDLQGSGSWQVQSPATTFTDVNGQALWRLTCAAAGNQQLSVAVAGMGYSLNLPACQESAQSFPTSPPSSSSFPRNTTTTRF
jgi:hypothetical protein